MRCTKGGIELKKTVYIALALIFVCATMASAQQPGNQANRPAAGAPGGMAGGMMGMCPAMAVAPPSSMMIERSADTLGLSADQKTKLAALLTKNEATVAKLRESAQAASKALRDAVMAPTFDSAKASSLLVAAQKADAAVSDANLQTWVQVRSILTPAQVTKLSEATTRRTGGYGGEGRQDRDRARPGAGGGAPRNQ
jgi:Spy/CpxP family protein refolding chaperone